MWKEAASPLWHHVRQTRLTLSTLGKICKRKKTDKTIDTQLTEILLNPTKLFTHAVKHGLWYEKVALHKFSELVAPVKPFGVLINSCQPYFDASPDGAEGSYSASGSVHVHLSCSGPRFITRCVRRGLWRFISHPSTLETVYLSWLTWPCIWVAKLARWLAFWASTLWYSHSELLTTVIKTCQLG